MSNYEKWRYHRDAVACNAYSSTFDTKSTRRRKNRRKQNRNNNNSYVRNVSKKKKRKKSNKNHIPNIVWDKTAYEVKANQWVRIVHKNGKQNFSCFLCNVTDSAKNIKQHLNGKRHKKQVKLSIKYSQRTKHSQNNNQLKSESNNNANTTNSSQNKLPQNSYVKRECHMKNENINKKRSFNELCELCDNNDGNMNKKRKLNDNYIVKNEIKAETMNEGSIRMPSLEAMNDINDNNDVCIVSETKDSNNLNINSIDLVCADNIGVLVKFCPNCKIQVNRTQMDIDNRCSVMICTNCIDWTYWCWDCNAIVDATRQDMRCLNCRQISRNRRNCNKP
eukprot:272847_1